MEQERLRNLIEERFQWSGYNFILCIPLELDEYYYEEIRRNIGTNLFPRKTLHLSFGRFRISEMEDLNRILEVLEKCRSDTLFENITLQNRFQIFGNYTAFVHPKIKKLDAKIKSYFDFFSKLYKHDYIPHITISSDKLNIPIIEPKYIRKKISLSNLTIVLKGPVNGEYVELIGKIH